MTPIEKQAAENTQGFEPIQGESNGERAREFASGQGEGNHYGIEKQQAAGDGAKGNANANANSNTGNAYGQSGTKPTQEKQVPQRPEDAGRTTHTPSRHLSRSRR